MANKTKLVIITTTKDLIHQLSLIKDEQITSIENINNNNNTSDFLTQLFQLNSENDDMHKQTPDSLHENSLKPRKKSDDLICAICGNHAIGFNYDVISCASCKVFFRRYAAYQHSDRFKCITGHGQCSVAYTIRRKCQRCRLDRCFQMGMKTDFFLSEEEKQRRKNLTKKHNELVQHSQTFDEFDDFLMDLDQITNENIVLNKMENILCFDDWRIIDNIRLSFLSTFQSDDRSAFPVDVSNRASALISWSYNINEAILIFIQFFRQITQFESLDLHDRFVLIKYNFVPIFALFRCIYYKPINYCCSYEENGDAVKHRKFFLLCGDTNGIRDVFINLVISLVHISEQDPVLLSLLLTVLIFSQCLSMNDEQPLLKDPSSVNRAQLHYTKLLWIYLVNKLNEVQACKYFIQLITIILRLQAASKKLRDFFRTPIMSPDTVDKIAPLMQSVLHIC